MLKELDQFIQFLIDHIADDRIRLSKKMKYGFRHYYLTFVIDAEPEDGNQKVNYFRWNGSVEIVFDNRNNCIEVIDSDDRTLVIEDQELLNKWNLILEKLVNKDIGPKIQDLMESALASCYRKDLHREYKMKDLFDEGQDNQEETDF